MSSEETLPEGRVVVVRTVTIEKTSKKGSTYFGAGWRAHLYDRVLRSADGLPIWRSAGWAGPGRLQKVAATEAIEERHRDLPIVDSGPQGHLGPRNGQVALDLLDLLPRSDATATLLGQGRHGLFQILLRSATPLPGPRGGRTHPHPSLYLVVLARKDADRWIAELEIARLGKTQTRELASRLKLPVVPVGATPVLAGVQGRIPRLVDRFRRPRLARSVRGGSADPAGSAGGGSSTPTTGS